MRKLITAINTGEVFGPFNTVVTLSDRYLCDNSLEIQFNVIGDSTVSDMPADYVIPTGPEPVPEEVTRRQARLAMLLFPYGQSNLFDATNSLIAAISDPTQKQITQIYWEDSLMFHRNEPMLVSIAAQLGLSALDVDNLFITASKL